MKTRIAMLMAIALLFGAMAYAEDYVSISEIYEQAQLMGGVWQETFDTPNGEVTIDAPIIVPKVDVMPVLTLEEAKISEELYNHIIQGEKGGKKDQIQYDGVELGGKSNEFFLGYENDYKNGVKTNIVGYDAVETLWIQHGAYKYSGGKALMDRAEPSTYHLPWQIDPQQPCIRNSDLTFNDAMRLWQEDIDMCFPDDDFVIQPTTIIARGSTLTDKTGKGKEYKRDGYMMITAEQVIEGFPIIGGIIHEFGASHFAVKFTSDQKTNRHFEKMNKKYGVGVSSVIDYSCMDSRFSSEENYRTMNGKLAKVRTVEYADVPLASLENVLTGIEKEIEKGNLREVYSIRLGYVLYSNPDMTDHAWAIPRWVVSALYVTKGDQKHWEREQRDNAKHGYENPPWGEFYSEDILVDAQSGELLIFTLGDDTTYAVPKIITWDDI